MCEVIPGVAGEAVAGAGGSGAAAASKAATIGFGAEAGAWVDESAWTGAWADVGVGTGTAGGRTERLVDASAGGARQVGSGEAGRGVLGVVGRAA